MKPRSISGFTLIEVLLAMAITLFVAVIAYSGLSAALSAADSSEVQAKRLAEVQTALMMIERDIRHATLRSVVDEYGELRPPLEGSDTENYVLQLSRIGRDNPLGQRRGEIQRIRYLLENEELWREGWGVLDIVSEEEGLQRVRLLSGVKQVELEFLNPRTAGASQSPIGGEWEKDWPPINDAVKALPRAISFTLDIENFGEVRRVVEITSP